MKKWITVCHIIVTNTSVKDKRQKIKVKFHSFSTFCSMQFTREGIWKHSWSTAEREGEQEGEREWGFKLFLFKLFHLSSQSCTLRQRAKTLNAAEWTCDRPVASLRSWKNFWLKIFSFNAMMLSGTLSEKSLCAQHEPQQRLKESHQ